VYPFKRSFEDLYDDETLAEGVVQHAMDSEGLTFGEAVAMFQMLKGQTPSNNHPGAFKGFIPIKD
jgi:hypothetical protein